MNNGKVNIHGKEYETVASRIHRFRAAHPDWQIYTDIVTADQERVVMRCDICDNTGTHIATGHAEEVRASSQINRTSALENCETSAIGRALAGAGFGGTEYASADEVIQAIVQQSRPQPKRTGKSLAELEPVLKACTSLTQLQAAWAGLTEDERITAKALVKQLKEELA